MSRDLQSILSTLEKKAHIHVSSFLNENTYFLAIESAFNMIIITDLNAIIQYANPAVTRITGFSRNEVLGKRPNVWGHLMGSDYYRDLWKTIKSGRVFNSEITNHRKNGDRYIAQITISPIRSKEGLVGFIGTEEDITRERELLKEKEEFISMASHQLRTPLGSMKWNIELMQNDAASGKNDLNMLAQTNQYMIDMVNNLLAVLRIRNNRLEIRYESVAMAGFVREIIANLQDRMKEKKINLKLTLPEDTVRYVIDKLLIKEIVLNLVDNAVKYSLDGASIHVSVKKQRSFWALHVVDTGMGIEKKDLHKIVNKFYRGKNVSHIPGTGLGLYIINTYLQKMKGTLRIKSSLHRGTEVICTFPIRRLNNK